MPFPHDDTGDNWRRLTPEQFEACRHAREVNRCFTEGRDFTEEHCRALTVMAAERNRKVAGSGNGLRARAERIWKDVKKLSLDR